MIISLTIGSIIVIAIIVMSIIFYLKRNSSTSNSCESLDDCDEPNENI
jgi:hypothetical protein